MPYGFKPQKKSFHALTDPTGAITTRYHYSPYGDTTVTGEASSNPYQYTGRENDGTGLYYYRARYYDPGLQRFISQDPIGLAGGLNTYTYVKNNPLRYRDPNGLDIYFNPDTGVIGWGYPGIGVLETWPGVSGPHGNGPLPAGDYLGGSLREKPDLPKSPFCDSSGNCWFYPLNPTFPTNRTALGIHPDGNVPGTAGCIGVKSRNTKDLHDILKEQPGEPVHVWY